MRFKCCGYDYFKRHTLKVKFPRFQKVSVRTLLDKGRKIFNVAKYFPSDELQNYLIFVWSRQLQFLSSNTPKILSWKSTGISEESIKNQPTADISFIPKLIDNYLIRKVKFNANCLRQDSISSIHKNVVNLYTLYELDTWSRDLNIDFTLGNCLFGVVNFTKNADPDKYGCSGCGVRFDSRSQFLW